MLRSLIVLTLLVAGLPAHAEWKDKNKQINATNFIIMESGRPICSATLISLKYKLIISAHHCIDGFVSSKELEETAPDGTLYKVKREVLADVTVSQKSYQAYRLVGDSSYQAVIVARKRTADMTLLQLRADVIPQTTFSQVLPDGNYPERGDRVWVVGNPLGFLDASLTSGIISSTTRMMRVPWADDSEVAFIQTDAAINGGNSGGALYDDDGQLIGIPDAGWAGASGLGLTLTTDSIRDFLSENCYAELYKADAPTHAACMAVRKKRMP